MHARNWSIYNADKKGKAQCTSMSILGTFANATGYTVCLSCELGTYQDAPGESSPAKPCEVKVHSLEKRVVRNVCRVFLAPYLNVTASQ